MSLGMRACVAVAVLLAIAPMARAGTDKDPEWTDTALDHKTTSGDVPVCDPQPPATNACFLNADLLAGWVSAETATHFTVNLKVSGTGEASTLGSAYDWDFFFTVAGTAYTGRVHRSGSVGGPLDGAITPSGACGTAAIADGVISCTVAKSAAGNPAGGATLTAFGASALGYPGSQDQPFVSDDGPDAPGRDYTFTGGPAPAANATGNATGNMTGGPDGNGTAPPGNGTEDPGPADNATAGPSDSGAPANGTAPATTSDKGSPGLAVAVVLAAVAAIAVAVRRRL